MRHLLLSVVLISGCSTSGTFGEDAARTACAEEQRCDPNAFEEDYANLGECVDTFDEVFGGDCYLEHCDGFDGQAANSCLAEVRTQDCSDNTIPTVCEDAWTDCATIQLGICLLAAGVDQFF